MLQEKRQKYPPLPNVVIIYADDLGYGDVSAYGATEISHTEYGQTGHGGSKIHQWLLHFGHLLSQQVCPAYRGLSLAQREGKDPGWNGTSTYSNRSDDPSQDVQRERVPYRHRREVAPGTGRWTCGLESRRLLPAPMKWDLIMPISWQPPRTGFQRFISRTAGWCDPIPRIPLRSVISQNFPGEPTGMDNPELLKMKWHHGHFNTVVNGISRIGYMKGGTEARWVDENMADTFLVRAQQYIRGTQGRALLSLLRTSATPCSPYPPSTLCGENRHGSQGRCDCGSRLVHW